MREVLGSLGECLSRHDAIVREAMEEHNYSTRPFTPSRWSLQERDGLATAQPGLSLCKTRPLRCLKSTRTSRHECIL